MQILQSNDSSCFDATVAASDNIRPTGQSLHSRVATTSVYRPISHTVQLSLLI